MSAIKKSATALAEEEILRVWVKEKTFEKSLANRKGAKHFNFNDGPPFANGLPHFGHSLVTAVKDSMLRYKTMRGFYVPRRNGWDCHGLPVEYSVEKQFGVSGKKQILELGLEKFNAACRASIFKYKADWEDFLSRIGRWSNYKHYYATVDTNYTESIWWILKEIYKKGLLYRGFKSLPYCPRCATPLSNFELNEGYRDDVPDPSVFALFPLTPESRDKLQQRLGLDVEPGSQEERASRIEYGKQAIDAADVAIHQEGRRTGGSADRQDGPSVSLLAWTTTPWTLPANTALAVDPQADYVYVRLKEDNSQLILAKQRLVVLDLGKSEYKVLKTVKGKELVGLHYEPIYKPDESKYTKEQLANGWQVFATDYTNVKEGTGIVHTGTSYGEVDLDLILKKNLPRIESVNSAGELIFGPQQAMGKFFKEADEPIIADLTHKGRIFAAESGFKHTYPFCWRCDTPLMYFATNTWFIEVTKVKNDLLKAAEDINWVPAHIKSGRFGKWLEGARDWAISRHRYWGAPMPIWQNIDDDNDYIVVGSLAELEELAGKEAMRKLPKVAGRDDFDLHRPCIDDIVIKKDGKTYKRIDEVLDCWFESGSMPIAQWHYPFENKNKFRQTFPADFITEAIDQTRLWFYVQHVIATILFNRPAYKQVIVTGFMMAADGQKLSKRLRNYPPVEDVFASEGADSLRLYLLSRTQATEMADYMRFDRSAMTDIHRNVLDTLTNSFRFFKTYSELDKWPLGYARGKQPYNPLQEPKADNILDRWILARLEETISAATKSADGYKIAHTLLPIFELIDDLSNWYIRRSRRRFWKSENDKDKKEAYATLHYVLVRVCQLMAPWAPFVSDQLWRELTKGTAVVQSVHLSDWPSAGQRSNKQDNASLKLLENMQKARNLIINEGLSQRAAAGIKVRQPLASVSINTELANREEFESIITEELNVKAINWLTKGAVVKVDTKLTKDLKKEGVMREVVRHVQNARKNAGLNVDDRIKLRIESDFKDVKEAVRQFKDTIFSETLAKGELEGDGVHTESVKVEGQEVKINLSKV